jgi:hypothetical protein
LGTCNAKSQTCRLGFCARGSPSTRSSTSACGSSMIATTLHALHAQAALNMIIHTNVCTASAGSKLGPMTQKPSWRSASAREMAGMQPREPLIHGCHGRRGALCEVWMVHSAGDINLVRSTSVRADFPLEQLHSHCLAILQHFAIRWLALLSTSWHPSNNLLRSALGDSPCTAPSGGTRNNILGPRESQATPGN